VINQPVTITHWDWWVTQSPWLDNEINLFQQANPNITITRTVQSGTFADLLNLAFRDNSAPDVYFFNPGDVATLVEQEQAKPISDFADFAEFQATFPSPAVWSAPINGNFYSAPREAISSWWNQLYVHTGILEQYGYVNNDGSAKLPTTMAEFLEACRLVATESNGQVYGYGNPFSSGWTPIFWWYNAQLSGGNLTSRNGFDFKTGRYDWDTNPVWQELAESFVTLRDENLILPESATIDDEGIRALFAEGRYAFLHSGVWSVSGWEQTHPEFSQYTLIPPPRLASSTAQSYFYTTPPVGGAGNTFINSRSENTEAAWEWFKWLHSRPAMQRWVAAGQGLSLWGEDNDPALAQNAALSSLFANDAAINRVGPALTVRNPNIALVNEEPARPDENAILVGIFTGQITDIEGALKQLADDRNAALDQGIADANAAGLSVSRDDYAFPDWDPTQDYVTQPV
jgi:ABC-type glycerol-3-phosphate transport system substrate-binding protein